MVRDLIANTKYNLKINKIKTIKDVYNFDNSIVCFSNKFLSIEKEMRFFLRTKMYNNKNVLLKTRNTIRKEFGDNIKIIIVSFVIITSNIMNCLKIKEFDII